VVRGRPVGLTMDPVSWLMIEPGWKVKAADGKDAGKVIEVVGDSEKDIFNGLAISIGFFAKARYVPAERVTTIVDGEVHLDLPPKAVRDLEEFERPPASEQILPPDRTA
jgi:hypothetical protein